MLNIDDENNIYLTRGDTAYFDVLLTDEEGVAYQMGVDEIIVFSVRRISGKGEVLITKTSDSPSFELTTNDTKLLSFGKYKYDIFLYNSTNEKLDTFIADKIFELGEEVHDFE